MDTEKKSCPVHKSSQIREGGKTIHKHHAFQMTLFSQVSYTGQMHGIKDLCMDYRLPQVLEQAIFGSLLKGNTALYFTLEVQPNKHCCKMHIRHLAPNLGAPEKIMKDGASQFFHVHEIN